MSRKGYRHFAHTADVGLTTWGPSLADAYSEAILGTAAVTYELGQIQPRLERVVQADADDLARLLVDLLDDVLYLADSEGFVPSRAEVEPSPGRAIARLRGELFDPARHQRAGPQVKAITYHDIQVDPGPPARVRLILDI
jgi:SHS2 domain-containing protein